MCGEANRMQETLLAAESWRHPCEQATVRVADLSTCIGEIFNANSVS